MGFLANLGLAAGRNLLYGQDFQEKQEDITLKKQQLQMGQMAIQKEQKQQQDEQAVGQFLASEAQADASNVTDPVKAAQTFEKGAAKALQMGDFAIAKQMGDLAKGKMDDAKEQATVVAQQLQVKKEDLANAAFDYVNNPSPQVYSDLQKKAVAAGVNPSEIPPPGTPQAATWANKQTLVSKTAAQKADFVQKYAEMDDNRREKQQEFNIRQQDLQESRKQTAMLRESAAEDRKMRLDMEKERLSLDKEKFKSAQEGGGKMSVQQQRDTSAIAGAAAEGARNLRNISHFQLGTASSPFQNLSDHGVLDAAARAGTNAFTPETVQMFQTAGAGLATQVARVETLGAGRGGNQAQVDQLEKQLTPVAGDHPLTQLYKVATGAQLLLTRMENTPAPRDPGMKAQWDKTIDELSKYPQPEAILGVASSAQKKELTNLDKSYSANLTAIRSSGEGNTGGGLPGGADAGAGTNVPPIPQGWSVHAH